MHFRLFCNPLAAGRRQYDGCIRPDAAGTDARYGVHGHPAFGGHIPHREEHPLHVLLRRQADRPLPTREPQGEANADFSRLEGKCSPRQGLNFTITERQIALIPARKSPARQRTITGVVNDFVETPLAGVAVTLVGDNTRGAVTEANGSFTLTVPDADITLSFTYLGYVSKKVAVPATQNNVKVFARRRRKDGGRGGRGLRNPEKEVNLTGAIATVDENSCRTGRRPRWPTCCKAPCRDSRSRLRRDARAIRPASTSAASPRSTAVRRWCWSTAPKAT